MSFTPLFPGRPGGAELMMQFVVLVLPILYLIGRWVYRDATAYGSNWAWQWAVVIVVSLLLGLVHSLPGGSELAIFVPFIYFLVRGVARRGSTSD